MAKLVAAAVLDAALDKVATSTRMVICSTQPTNFAGIAAVNLGQVTMSGADFTKSAGTTSGRKTTVAAKSGISITASGTATHLSLDDGTTLLYVTTITSQAVTSGNTASTGAWTVEIADPA